MGGLKEIRQKVEQLKGRQSLIKEQIRETRGVIKDKSSRIEFVGEARSILQAVAQKTQQQLEYHISEIVTLALNSVFDEPYQLKVIFTPRRGKTEADILFKRDGQEFDPMGASGGGPVDVAAFALRVALWSLQNPRTRPVLILDEPMRFLSRDLQPRASRMLVEISERLGLQIIMVSHNPELIEAAHKSFEVTMKKGISVMR